MKVTKLIFLLSTFVTLGACYKVDTPKSHLKLWYRSPAKASIPDQKSPWKDDQEWLKALPLGNGSLGAMVFGDVNKERIQLNEESLWSGSPDDNDNPAALPALLKIREYLFRDNYKDAELLARKTQICKGSGSGYGNGGEVPFGCYQTLGDLWIDFGKNGDYTDYHRELDLDEATVRVQYKQDDVVYKREIFVSQPDQVMVIKLSASKPKSLSFTTRLTRPEGAQTLVKQDELIMKGVLPNGKGGEGMAYMARLTAVNKGGNLSFGGDKLVVSDADEVMLILSASTDYKLDYPTYKGRDYEALTAQRIQKSRKISYETLFKRHLKEYQGYYNRVDFKLTQDLDTIPTDVRIANIRKGGEDEYLVEKIFQYGRYLLIASSRPGSLPANLQGIWANKIQTPWNGDYHTDVNVQMNYWPAETANLAEMHLPLFDLLGSLEKAGKSTARIHYNANGWVVHPITNVWGYTSPGEQSSWGMHVGGGAWLTTHIMEHYYFTMDTMFLQETFPILESSVEFYKDWLVEDPETGELLSGPSVSPENTFLAPDGTKTQICMGPSHDQQVIWQLFNNYIDACEVLGKRGELLISIQDTLKKLGLPKIGSDGRLMEWNEEFKEIEPGHRHISHLFGLYPGYQIDLRETPALANAAKKSLDFRVANGSGYTGWSGAWLINQYARLGEGENGVNTLNKVLSKSININLLGSHPPFQIDANFGLTAGIAEMLIQSHSDAITLLPATPKRWQKGSVKGLCARGGFVIDIDWDDGEIMALKVYAKKGGKCVIRYKNDSLSFQTSPNKTYFPLEEGLLNVE